MNRTSLVVVAFATLAALVAVPGLASGQGGPPFWSLTGNGGTDPAVNFVGTTDAADFIVKTNSTEAVRVTPGGHVGIGTASPGAFGIAEPLFSLDIRNPNPFSSDTFASISSHLGQATLQLFSVNEEASLNFGNARNGEPASSAIVLDRNTDALHFCVAANFNCQFSTEVRLSIEPSGDIGVGTKTPQSALQIVGYTQLDLTAGAPPAADCDHASERGRMKVDSGAGLLYVCVDAGWMAK